MKKVINGYNGQDYFWHHDYRFNLRDATAQSRRNVRNALIKSHLSLGGNSPAHTAIVEKFAKTKPKYK